MAMNLDDEYVSVFVSRRQLIMMLQAIDAMIDDAASTWVASSIEDATQGGRSVDVRDIDIDDVCDDHLGDVAMSRRRVDKLQSLFDDLVASDERLARWSRDLIAVSLHELANDVDIDMSMSEDD